MINSSSCCIHLHHQDTLQLNETTNLLIWYHGCCITMLFYSLILTLMTINAATFPTLSRPRRLTIDFILTPYTLHIIIWMRIMWTAFKMVLTFQLHAWHAYKRKLDHINLTKLTFFPAMISPILCSAYISID